MKQALDRLYATLAHVHELIDEAQLDEAYEMCLRGEASTLLQALAQRGWLTETHRVALDRHARTCLIRTADALLVSRGAARIRQRLREDPTCRDELVERFPDRDRRGRYRLLEFAGEGGMGRVWLARDETLNRTVALKELKQDLADQPNARARLIREAQITGRLEHPYIVPIHELQSDGMLYYAMRLLRGATFADVIAAYHGRKASADVAWDQPRLLAVFVQVCQALAFAHSHGVVHRDLKPANIVLGNFGEVFVVDWGLARDLKATEAPSADGEMTSNEDSRMTRAGQTLGTPAYMSPEQAAGQSQHAGPPADIFGLGAILFEILTGVTPHAKHTSLPLSEMLAQIATNPVPQARQVRADVPAALEAVCAKALAHEPDRRYASALDLAEDVRRWTLGEPVGAYREPWSMRVRRWAVRHRRLTLSSAALATALSCALLAFSVAAWRDGAAVEERTRMVLETRAEMQRSDLLSDVTFNMVENKERARSRTMRQLIESPGPPAAAAEARRLLAEDWAAQMRDRPYLLAFALVDRGDAARTWVRVQRDRDGGPVTFTSDTTNARSALAQTLAEVKRGPGPHFVGREIVTADGTSADQLETLVVTSMNVPGHDAWLISQFDFTALMQQMVKPMDRHAITVVMRNEAGEVLATAGDPKTVALYGGDEWSDAVDPRLGQFFAADDPAPALQGWHEWKRTHRIPPIDPSHQLTLSNCRPNNDIVHAYKIHYSPHMPERYLGVVMVAPYEQLVARTVAGSDFLTLLMVLSVIAVLVVVLLAFRLFAPPRRAG